KKRKGVVQAQEAPDRNEEIFLYQTLIGSWPLEKGEVPRFRDRVEAYMIKAIREAMVHTRWSLPNAAHERALAGFLRAILEPGGGNLFLNDFLKFQRRIAKYGMLNSLAQVLVKMTSPGVPDFYQGCDLWDLRLVDPDNRGPVVSINAPAFFTESENAGNRVFPGLVPNSVQSWEAGGTRANLY